MRLRCLTMMRLVCAVLGAHAGGQSGQAGRAGPGAAAGRPAGSHVASLAARRTGGASDTRPTPGLSGQGARRNVSQVSFPCAAVAPAIPAPRSARELHPAHVGGVMALGDSVSAAFTAVHALPLEFRGLSAAVGEGGADQPTLPWILRHFSPRLVGASRGWQIPELVHTLAYANPGNDRLNAALSGAETVDLPAEVQYLQRRATELFKPTPDAHWKVLTIFIGFNDLCPPRACTRDLAQRQGVATRIYQQLDQLFSQHLLPNFTKLYVNLVTLFMVSSVGPVDRPSWLCGAKQAAFHECRCVFDKQPNQTAAETAEFLNWTTVQANREIEAIAAKYDGVREDVAVNLVDGFRNQNVPDRSFVSDLDCFHPTAKAHAVMAVSIWNAMLRVSHPRPMSMPQPICPDAHTRFVTYRDRKLVLGRTSHQQDLRNDPSPRASWPATYV
mmetsp:Transcript_72563/g.222216  ORF Transcript_72563/g.222216 Transcript_72563/m.222216 type:complete len:443 (-) Transcript_72563:207-1535(-)